MKIPDIIKELEFFLSDLTFSGLDNIDKSFIEQLKDISKKAENYEMINLQNILEDLIYDMEEYYNKKTDNIKKIFTNVSKLDFYIKNALHF